MIKLSIIIVNYKTPQLVLDCIRSIKQWEDRVGYEIIVIDNSPDNSGAPIVCVPFPDVIWHFMGDNAGFARANNKGIELSKGEVVLLLNSDTINVDDAIQNCYERFVASAHIACGVHLLNEDGSSQISGNYFMTGSLNNLLPLPVIGTVLKTAGVLLAVKKPHEPSPESEVKVDWINGAFLMVKKVAIEKVGRLDPDFFLYAEEAEWCYRLSKIGTLCVFGEYKVIHLQGESANKTFGSESKGYYDLYSKKGLQIMLSNLVRIRKQFGVGWLLFHFATLLFEIPLFLVLAVFRSIINVKNFNIEISRPFLFMANVARLASYLPTLVSGKPFFYKVL